jgi:hypothetical protein
MPLYIMYNLRIRSVVAVVTMLYVRQLLLYYSASSAVPMLWHAAVNSSSSDSSCSATQCALVRLTLLRA